MKVSDLFFISISRMLSIRNIIYLNSFKCPLTYYYHEFDNIVDNDKSDDGICFIKKNTMLHLLIYVVDGNVTAYYLDNKKRLRMRTLDFDYENYIRKYNSDLEFKKLYSTFDITLRKEHSLIKKLNEYIKDFYS